MLQGKTAIVNVVVQTPTLAADRAETLCELPTTKLASEFRKTRSSTILRDSPESHRVWTKCGSLSAANVASIEHVQRCGQGGQCEA